MNFLALALSIIQGTEDQSSASVRVSRPAACLDGAIPLMRLSPAVLPHTVLVLLIGLGVVRLGLGDDGFRSI